MGVGVLVEDGGLVGVGVDTFTVGFSVGFATAFVGVTFFVGSGVAVGSSVGEGACVGVGVVFGAVSDCAMPLNQNGAVSGSKMTIRRRGIAIFRDKPASSKATIGFFILLVYFFPPQPSTVQPVNQVSQSTS